MSEECVKTLEERVIHGPKADLKSSGVLLVVGPGLGVTLGTGLLVDSLEVSLLPGPDLESSGVLLVDGPGLGIYLRIDLGLPAGLLVDSGPGLAVSLWTIC